MPRRPLMTSLVAASCGSLPSRNFPAMASNAVSRVMVTDSVAFCANPANSGIASLGFGAAHARVGTSSANSKGNVYFLMKKFLDCNLNARLLIGERRRLALHRFICKVQFLAGYPQRLQHFAPRLQSALTQSLF